MEKIPLLSNTKNKYAFFCGKFDTYDLSKDSSIIVKNEDDLRLVKYILSNKTKKESLKTSYDFLLKNINIKNNEIKIKKKTI